jgi:hypothetical protein
VHGHLPSIRRMPLLRRLPLLHCVSSIHSRLHRLACIHRVSKRSKQVHAAHMLVIRHTRVPARSRAAWPCAMCFRLTLTAPSRTGLHLITTDLPTILTMVTTTGESILIGGGGFGGRGAADGHGWWCDVHGRRRCRVWR